MKKINLKISAIIISGFILFSCNTSTPLTEQKPTFDSMSASLPVEDNVDRDDVFNYTNTSLASDQEFVRAEKFSNDSIEDTFTVILPKGAITKTKTTLIVSSKSGKIIYQHIFSTTELINEYDLGAIKTDKEMMDYIITKAGDVIGKGLVDLNTISDNDYLAIATKEAFTNYDLFMDMRAKGRRLLNYTLNLENHYYLGYSDKDKKVVTIIECC
ncbi:MAG: hypothetical protein H0W73_18480 [Bacteroidetes bacterium]|nr:hypothetical protein [Bacteroidota bacterium]